MCWPMVSIPGGSVDNAILVLCPDHTSHEENGLVNQVKFLGPITGMW